jgi:hypothetical protein
MVAQPVALYEKPGSPALPREAPSSVSVRTMANNGEVNGAGAPGGSGAAAPGGAAPGGRDRYDPFTAAVPATGATATPTVVVSGQAVGARNSSPGFFASATLQHVGSPEQRSVPLLGRPSEQQEDRATMAAVAATAMYTPPRRLMTAPRTYACGCCRSWRRKGAT